MRESGGRPVQRGWRHREEVARDKFGGWVGAYGGMSAGEVLATWPDDR
ncbi:hypothetical protein [Streptomyces sp. NPDC029554]